MTARPNPRPAKTVLGLALSDLRHEWILTLCLVLAIAAVISPLLILMGLKYGTIETLRCSLVEDPVYREVRPAQTREYNQNWFATWRQRPEIDFLLPTILPASSIISVVQPDSNKTRFVDLIPTGPGDPLILENGGSVPEADECVLTTAAAQELGVSAGEMIVLRATRNRGGRREHGEARLRIASVLSPRASGLSRIYAPLDFVLDVETYKEGMAVPSRDWPGGTPHPYPSFDGMLVIMPKPLDPVTTAGLTVNTGMTKVETMDTTDFQRLTGFTLPTGYHAYNLEVRQNTVQLSSYRAIKGKLRGRGALVLPYTQPIELTLSGARKPRRLHAFGISISSKQARVLELPELPWGRLQEQRSYASLGRVLLPVSLGIEGKDILVRMQGKDHELEFPLTVAGKSPGDYALIPVELAGVLRTGMQRKIMFDPQQDGFLLARTGFQGFRMYARSIDDVLPLVSDLRAQGLEVIAQVQEIQRVRVLDQGLTSVFWLVAIVGISGGIAALVASLYAAVQRKQRDLSVMRLLGLARLDVFQFPVYQSLTMALLSLIVALSGYLALATVINQVFAADLSVASQACQGEQKICTLPPSYVLVAVVATLVVALLSSLFAAWKATQIDPAEALRDE